jgi:hypothetical protein
MLRQFYLQSHNRQLGEASTQVRRQITPYLTAFRFHEVPKHVKMAERGSGTLYVGTRLSRYLIVSRRHVVREGSSTAHVRHAPNNVIAGFRTNGNAP